MNPSKPYPTDLNDKEWDLIKHLGPAANRVPQASIVNRSKPRQKGDPWIRCWQAGQIRLEITKRSDAVKGFVVIPKRWIVERTFG